MTKEYTDTKLYFKRIAQELVEATGLQNVGMSTIMADLAKCSLWLGKKRFLFPEVRVRVDMNWYSRFWIVCTPETLEVGRTVAALLENRGCSVDTIEIRERI